MEFNSNEVLEGNGFKGFIRVKDLWVSRDAIPKKMGTYLVINPEFKKPSFITPGVGGHFKGKDPNVSIEELMRNHVPSSQVVYIGKAGGGESKATLHSRLGQYLRFGLGKPVGHWGGRYIWQLKNHQDLLFCWRADARLDPRNLEQYLILKFEEQFGKKPFANLVY